MRNLIIGCILGALLTVGTTTVRTLSAAPAVSHSWKVGFGKPLRDKNGRPILAATASAGTLTVSRAVVHVNPDNSTVVDLLYTSSGSNMALTRTLNIPNIQAAPITDVAGNTVSATVPTSLFNAIATFASQLDTQIGNAATGGKLNL